MHETRDNKQMCSNVYKRPSGASDSLEGLVVVMKHLMLLEQPHLTHIVVTVAAFDVLMLEAVVQQMSFQTRVIACLVRTRLTEIDLLFERLLLNARFKFERQRIVVIGIGELVGGGECLAVRSCQCHAFHKTILIVVKRAGLMTHRHVAALIGGVFGLDQLLLGHLLVLLAAHVITGV